MGPQNPQVPQEFKPEPEILVEPEIKIEPEVKVDEPSVVPASELEPEDKFKEFLKLGNPARQKNMEKHLQQIIAFAQEKKELTNQDVRDLVHVSQSTATDYLKALVNKGVLRINKRSRKTSYLF